MLSLKNQIFGRKGYSADMKLNSTELELFRKLIGEQWISVIRGVCPSLADEAERLGVERYHEVSDKLDHKTLWPKANRAINCSIILTYNYI